MTYAPPQNLVDYWTEKAAITSTLRAGMGPNWVVGFAGDSRADSWPYQTLGGVACYPLGLPGADVRDAAAYLPRVCQNLSARVVVLQIGINCLWVPLNDPRWQTLQQDFSALVLGLRTWSPHVVVTTPIPLEKGAMWSPARPDSDVAQRCQWLAPVATAAKAAAATQGATLVDLWSLFVQSDGTAKAGTTFDGVHFTPATAAAIKDALDPVVAGLFAS